MQIFPTHPSLCSQCTAWALWTSYDNSVASYKLMKKTKRNEHRSARGNLVNVSIFQLIIFFRPFQRDRQLQGTPKCTTGNWKTGIPSTHVEWSQHAINNGDIWQSTPNGYWYKYVNDRWLGLVILPLVTWSPKQARHTHKTTHKHTVPASAGVKVGMSPLPGGR